MLLKHCNVSFSYFKDTNMTRGEYKVISQRRGNTARWPSMGCISSLQPLEAPPPRPLPYLHFLPANNGSCLRRYSRLQRLAFLNYWIITDEKADPLKSDSNKWGETGVKGSGQSHWQYNGHNLSASRGCEDWSCLDRKGNNQDCWDKHITTFIIE